MTKTCGIYKITNKLLNKSYIGQSIHIEDRWKEHMWGKGSVNLHNDFKIYGLENFQFEILEICNPEFLLEREKYWIKFYNTYENGYNLNDGGDNSKYAIEKTKKKVYCYNLQGEFLTEYDSISEAERQTGISNSNICRAIKTCGRTQKFLWSYEKADILPAYKRKVSHAPKQGKSVLQYSKEGILLNQFRTLAEAKQITGISDASISQVCKGKRKTAGGYIWKLVEEE